MQKNLKIGIAVAAAAILVGTGVYAGYVLSNPGSPCPSSTSASTSSSGAVKSAGTAAAISGAEARVPRTTVAPVHASSEKPLPSSPGQVINVVAAENFWGSLVAQIGGIHVNVTSIVTDPNTDPHEYQANDSDAKAIAAAQYVIVNNVGYDTWATQLIGADGDTNQTILNVGDSLGVSVTGGIVTGNPHLWYNPAYVNQTVAWMYHNLTTIAPSLSGYFTDQYDNLTASLGALYSHVTEIKDLFHGTEVASTESIFVYLANATGLDLVSPPAFMEAIAENNDPPDSSVVEFECQLESGNVKVLVYNEQTVTPITTTMKQIAAAHNVTTIFVTETLQPPGNTFQEWMLTEFNNLENALNANALGQ